MDELVSVYLPTFNRVELLGRAVESVLSQSYENLEVIVVDDGSDDGTIERMCEWEKADTRVKFVQKNGVPKGVQYSRNLALGLARGRYVTGLDDDDYFHPDRVKFLLHAYKDELAGVGSNYYCVGKHKTWRNSIVPRTVTEKNLYTWNLIGNQILTERERMLEVGAYDEGLSASQDVDLWIRLIKKYGPLRRIAKSLYYVDTSHDMERISISDKRREGTLQFLRKHRDGMSRHQIRFRERNLVAGSRHIYEELTSYGVGVAIERLRTKFKMG